MKPKTPLLFLDTETTGTEPDEHRIFQCYAEFPELNESINIIMKPCDDDESFIISPGALRTTGVDIRQILEEGVSQREGAIALSRFIQQNVGDKATVVCHNSGFDKDFVMAWFKREKMLFKDNFSYHWRCTLHMAMYYQDLGFIKGWSLKLIDLCEEMGIILDNAHEASADVKGTIAVYNRFVEWTKIPNTEPGSDYNDNQDVTEFDNLPL